MSTSNPFFDHPILNSPYQRPTRYWELDEAVQPTQRILDDAWLLQPEVVQ